MPPKFVVPATETIQKSPFAGISIGKAGTLSVASQLPLNVSPDGTAAIALLTNAVVAILALSSVLD